MYNLPWSIFVSFSQSWNYEITMFPILLPIKGGGFIQSLSQTFEKRGPITFDQVFLSFKVFQGVAHGTGSTGSPERQP